MRSTSIGPFVWYSFWLVILTIIIFTALHWLNIPSGQLIDWIIGTVTCWWLLIIVTVPWNVHFEAKSALAELEKSADIGIAVKPANLNYIKIVARRSLIIAIALHIISATGLFLLSAAGISPVGYVGCALALLLTVVRPSVRLYEYLKERLSAIRREVKYPREDVVELRERTAKLEGRVLALERQLDPKVVGSYADQQLHSIDEINRDLRKLTTAHNELDYENKRDHERLSKEAQNSIAKLSADSQFLDHVREIVRLIKSA